MTQPGVNRMPPEKQVLLTNMPRGSCTCLLLGVSLPTTGMPAANGAQIAACYLPGTSEAVLKQQAQGELWITSDVQH